MRRPADTDKLTSHPQEQTSKINRSNHGATAPQQVPEGWLWLGQVGRPHGVRGAFFLKTEDNRSDWPGYKKLLLQAKTEKIVAVEKAYVSGGKLALQLSELNSREITEELYNAHLFVARSDVRLDEQEYLVADLVGCDVWVEGRADVFGRVIGVHNFGAQETLEIERIHGPGETVLYPFTEAFVVEVNAQTRKIVVRDESAFLDEV